MAHDIKNTRVYSDFDLDFIAHPLTGDVSIKVNEEAIKRAIRQLIFLDKYDKPFHPEISSSIRSMLFEPILNRTVIGIETRIRFLIKQYEKRAELIDINTIADEVVGSYDISITFRVVNQLDPIIQRIFLQRVR